MAEVEINFQPTRAGAQSARGKIKLFVNESLSRAKGLIRLLMGWSLVQTARLLSLSLSVHKNILFFVITVLCRLSRKTAFSEVHL